MESSLIALGGLALIDCINPSAIVVALYLLTGERPAGKIVAYPAGIVSIYLALGVLLLLGLDAALARWNDLLWSRPAFAVQGVLGVAMLVYSIIADPKGGRNRLQGLSGATGFAALYALGGVITFAEFSTALPYFAAIGLLTYMDLPPAFSVGLLLGYNVIFVLPPYLLLGLHLLFSGRLETRFDSLKERLQRAGREAALWIFGIVGFYLAFDALVYFEFFGLLPVNLPEGIRSPSEALIKRYFDGP